MARLKCSKCGSTFEKVALPTYGVAGLSGLAFGLGLTLPTWPFALRLYAKCPVCNKRGWIKVLKPKKPVEILSVQKP